MSLRGRVALPRGQRPGRRETQRHAGDMQGGTHDARLEACGAEFRERVYAKSASALATLIPPAGVTLQSRFCSVLSILKAHSSGVLISEGPSFRDSHFLPLVLRLFLFLHYCLQDPAVMITKAADKAVSGEYVYLLPYRHFSRNVSDFSIQLCCKKGRQRRTFHKKGVFFSHRTVIHLPT